MMMLSKISANEKDALMVHLVRSDEVLRAVSGILDPECFNNPLEINYKIIWKVARDYWLEHKRLIPKMYLVGEIKKIIESPAVNLLDEEKVNLFKLVDVIYACDSNHINISYALPIAQALIDERKLVPLMEQMKEDYPKFLDTFTSRFKTTRVHSADAKVDLMSKDEPIYAAETRNPTNLSFFDTILGGGIRPPETYGLLGPSGGGKTTFAIQLMCEMCKSAKHVDYFTFEQPIKGDLSIKFYACLTHRKYRDYEGTVEPEAAEAVNKMRPVVGPYMHMFDHAGNQDRGFGGVDEIDAMVYKECNEGRAPDMIIVDWLLPLVERQMSTNNIDSNHLRTHMRNAVDKFVILAKNYNTTVFLLHQLSPKAASNSSLTKPKWTDATECKSLSFMLNYTLALGTKDSDNRMWLCGSKSRANANIEKVIELDGERSMFKDCDDSFTVDSRSGRKGFVSNKIARPTYMDKVVEASKDEDIP